jgi:hypothetical protein
VKAMLTPPTALVLSVMPLPTLVFPLPMPSCLSFLLILPTRLTHQILALKCLIHLEFPEFPPVLKLPVLKFLLTLVLVCLSQKSYARHTVSTHRLPLRPV